MEKDSPEFQRFQRMAQKQEEKGRDWVTALDKQADLAEFRAKYGATKHVDKIYCPSCGSKQLYNSTFAEGTYLVCRECKAWVFIEILTEPPK